MFNIIIALLLQLYEAFLPPEIRVEICSNTEVL